MAELEIASRSIRESPSVLLLELEGGIDVKSYPVLEQALAKVQKDGCCRLVLKLAGVRFMNEAERLLSYDAAFREAGGGLVLYEVPAKLRVLLGTLELDKKLAIRGSLDDAIAALVEGQPVDRRQRSATVANERRADRAGGSAADRRAPGSPADRRVGGAAADRRAPRDDATPEATKPGSSAGSAKPPAPGGAKAGSAGGAKPAAASAGGARSSAPTTAKAGGAKPAAAGPTGKSTAKGASKSGPSAAAAKSSPASSSPATRSAKSSAGPARAAREPAADPVEPSRASTPRARRGTTLVLLVVGLAGAAYLAYAFLYAH